MIFFEEIDENGQYSIWKVIMTTSEMYSEFIKSFPKFEQVVKDYKRYSDDSIQIFTKQGKSFVFSKKDGEIRLTSI